MYGYAYHIYIDRPISYFTQVYMPDLDAGKSTFKFLEATGSASGKHNTLSQYWFNIGTVLHLKGSHIKVYSDIEFSKHYFHFNFLLC